MRVPARARERIPLFDYHWSSEDEGPCAIMSKQRLNAMHDMKRPPEDPVREHRIEEEAVVDAYGPEERSTSWHCYLEDRLSFPFRATCSTVIVTPPLKKGESVEVIGMAPDDVCARDMLVMIRWQGRKLAVPLAQLNAIDPDEATAEAVGDWHYWVAQGNQF